MNLRPRRFLPSIPQLLAFEAVMRARSTVAAASELKLTQSTVSRLVQTLEDQVGRPLFHRHRKRLIPTEAGEAYCLEVSRAQHPAAGQHGLGLEPDRWSTVAGD